MKTSTVCRGNTTGILVLALAVLSNGCSATHAVSEPPAESEFLINYSGLQKNPDFPAAFVYVKPDVQWGKYSAIEVESVGVHVTDTSTGPGPEEQAILAGMLHNTMTEELGKYFDLVTAPAPNALRVRTAWNQAPNEIVQGWAIPQVRIIADVRDSVSGERLAAAVDERAERKGAFGRTSYERWSLVQPGIDYWSKRCAWHLWRLGVQLKPGATPPEEQETPILF